MTDPAELIAAKLDEIELFCWSMGMGMCSWQREFLERWAVANDR